MNHISALYTKIPGVISLKRYKKNNNKDLLTVQKLTGTLLTGIFFMYSYYLWESNYFIFLFWNPILLPNI